MNDETRTLTLALAPTLTRTQTLTVTSTTTRLPLHPNFKEDAVKPGFYTAEVDWIDLDKSKIKVSP